MASDSEARANFAPHTLHVDRVQFSSMNQHVVAFGWMAR